MIDAIRESLGMKNKMHARKVNRFFFVVVVVIKEQRYVMYICTYVTLGKKIFFRARLYKSLFRINYAHFSEI